MLYINIIHFDLLGFSAISINRKNVAYEKVCYWSYLVTPFNAYNYYNQITIFVLKKYPRSLEQHATK